MTDVEILEMTFNDTCTVERSVKEKDPNTGVTVTVNKVIYQNIKCAISKNDNQVVNTTNDVSTLVYNHKLFTSPSYEILEGDTVKVSSMGKISIYLASKGFLYPSHSETIVTYKGRA